MTKEQICVLLIVISQHVKGMFAWGERENVITLIQPEDMLVKIIILVPVKIVVL